MHIETQYKNFKEAEETIKSQSTTNQTWIPTYFTNPIPKRIQQIENLSKERNKSELSENEFEKQATNNPYYKILERRIYKSNNTFYQISNIKSHKKIKRNLSEYQSNSLLQKNVELNYSREGKKMNKTLGIKNSLEIIDNYTNNTPNFSNPNKIRRQPNSSDNYSRYLSSVSTLCSKYVLS